jgi:pyrroloquinoline quinone biosynthesis protein D
MMALDARPRLARGVRLKHDRVRDRWLLLAPERAFVLNGSALAVVRSLVDGDGTLGELAARVATATRAPQASADTVAFVGELARRGLVETCPS